MTNENERNRPRYPLDRRCVRTPVSDEVTPAVSAAEESQCAPGAVQRDDVTLPRNPFGSAFR